MTPWYYSHGILSLLLRKRPECAPQEMEFYLIKTCMEVVAATAVKVIVYLLYYITPWYLIDSKLTLITAAGCSVNLYVPPLLYITPWYSGHGMLSLLLRKIPECAPQEVWNFYLTKTCMEVLVAAAVQVTIYLFYYMKPWYLLHDITALMSVAAALVPGVLHVNGYSCLGNLYLFYNMRPSYSIHGKCN